MSDNINQPGEYDAVLGLRLTYTGTAILGGIEGVKQRLLAPEVSHRIAALSEALKYGQSGQSLIIQALNDSDELVRNHASDILEKINMLGIEAVLDIYCKKHYLIRFDGVYRSSIHYNCLIFYPNRRVINLGSSDSPQGIKNNFIQEFNNHFSSSIYRANNTVIEFSLSSVIGQVDYRGEINVEDDIIYMSWHNHINGCSGNDEYYFIKSLIFVDEYTPL